MAGFDFSPLRLCTSLALAKQVFNPQNSEINRHNQILLRPNEAYYQITNFNTDYAFTEATAMYVVDCTDAQLADVTSQADFDIFTQDGITQMAYEVGFLDLDFYQKTVFLKIVTDTYTFWSAPCNISNYYNKEYVRLEYQYYGLSTELGIDFTNAPIAGKSQTIGIRASYTDIETKREDKGYTQMSTALEVTGKALDTFFFKFLIEYSKTYDLLWLAKVLSADVIYIGWGETLPTMYRVTNKPAQKAGDRLGDSNLKPNEFSCCIDLSETKVWIPQMLDAFVVETRYPEPGYYTLAQFNDISGYLASLQFNRDIATPLTVGYTVKIFKDGVLLETLAPNDAQDRVSVTDDLLQINIVNTGGTELITENGVYDIVVDPVYDGFGSEWSGYAAGEWRIIIADADYDDADYEETEYWTGT